MVAMMAMKVAMRTCLGTSFRIIEIRQLEPVSTKVVASPMAIALRTLLVMASVGHMPSTCTKTGFCFHRPFRNGLSSVLAALLAVVEWQDKALSLISFLL